HGDHRERHYELGGHAWLRSGRRLCYSYRPVKALAPLYGEGPLLAHQATLNFPMGGTGSDWFPRLVRIRPRPGLTG
ncbi:MAG: hypothetical protein O7D94_10355, partial [Planctomycetota bacterium]|nr:hypothetical protein [Planctomycetota bacterium]